MYAKTTTFLTTAMLSLVFYGLSTSPVRANSASTEVGLHQTEMLIALHQATETSQAGTATPASSYQNIPGIVNSHSGSMVEIKLADGTSYRYQLSPSIANSPNLRRGAFVALNVDENQVVQEVQPAEVERTVEGIVRDIVGSRVTLELPDGQIETTTVAPAVATRMGLAPGVPLVVTSYQGITSTKLCLGQIAPPPISLPPVIQSPPIGGGDVPPIIPGRPIPALW